MPRWDALWTGGSLATMTGPAGSWGAIRDGALAVAGERIAWVGARAALPASPADCAREVHDLGGGWLTPGLIDCHTHLVFGGSRIGEFERRLEGESYTDIARAGGGILSTIAATRAAARAELVAAALPRLNALLAEGVTTVEIKSGYGLDLDTERDMLAAARELGRRTGARVLTTFLGAHAVPPEFAGRADAYVDFVCDTVLPTLAEEGLVDAVDAFCERIAFDGGQVDRVFRCARGLGLPVKLHADQLSDGGGAALAARHRALSADHLEHTPEEGVAALACAGTVAVLLPGAFYVLRETRLPPVDALRRHRVPIAIASDLNPGSSPVASLLATMNLACTLFRLTPAEALAGVTRCAARALGIEAESGTLEAGKRADLAAWDIESPAELAYWLGLNRLRQAVRAGVPVVA